MTLITETSLPGLRKGGSSIFRKQAGFNTQGLPDHLHDVISQILADYYDTGERRPVAGAAKIKSFTNKLFSVRSI